MFCACSRKNYISDLEKESGRSASRGGGKGKWGQPFNDQYLLTDHQKKPLMLPKHLIDLL